MVKAKGTSTQLTKALLQTCAKRGTKPDVGMWLATNYSTENICTSKCQLHKSYRQTVYMQQGVC
jgi:hypothetical protein